MPNATECQLNGGVPLSPARIGIRVKFSGLIDQLKESSSIKDYTKKKIQEFV